MWEPRGHEPAPERPSSPRASVPAVPTSAKATLKAKAPPQIVLAELPPELLRELPRELPRDGQDGEEKRSQLTAPRVLWSFPGGRTTGHTITEHEMVHEQASVWTCHLTPRPAWYRPGCRNR